MTRAILPVASHPASKLLLPGLVLIALYGALQGVASDTTGYWVGVVSSATVFTIFSCTFAALAGALSAGRLRGGRVLRGAPARIPVHIAWVSLWPCLALGVLLQAVGLGIASAGSWGAPGRFPWEVILAWIVMITFHASVGYGLGLLLPRVLAAPAAALLSYAWLGFTWSVTFTPLRYLAGLAISGCCAVYAELPWQAPAAVVLLSTAGITCIVVLLSLSGSTRARSIQVAGAMVVFALAVPLSIYVARDLGPYPSPPRTGDDLVCASASPATVCLFPEQRWQPVTDAVASISHALQRLESDGIRVPSRVTADLLDPSPDSVSLIYRRDFTADMTVNSLMTSLTPQRQEGDLCPRDDTNPRPALFVGDTVASVLFALATDRPEWVDAQEPEVAVASRTVLNLEPFDRADWINGAIEALADCSRPLPSVPEKAD